jgi:hypothetical protein
MSCKAINPRGCNRQQVPDEAGGAADVVHRSDRERSSHAGVSKVFRRYVKHQSLQRAGTGEARTRGECGALV